MPPIRFFRIGTLVNDADLAALINALDLLENILDQRLDSMNLADSAVTRAKLSALAVDYTKSSGLAGYVRGQYTGDGTQNRIINPGWDPTYVHIIRQSDSSKYESLNDGTNIVTWKTDNTGIASGGTTDWQGLVAGGFKLGSAVGGGLSNVAAAVYSYYALR